MPVGAQHYKNILAQWPSGMTGSPILADATAWVDCIIASSMPVGDHTIFVGEVQAGGVPGAAAPLLYHNRRWRQFAALESTP